MPDDKPRVVLLGSESAVDTVLRDEMWAQSDAMVLDIASELERGSIPLVSFPGGPEALRQMMEDARALGSSLERMERATTPPWTHGDPASLLYRKPKRSSDDTRDRKARRKRQSKARRKSQRKP